MFHTDIYYHLWPSAASSSLDKNTGSPNSDVPLDERWNDRAWELSRISYQLTNESPSIVDTDLIWTGKGQPIRYDFNCNWLPCSPLTSRQKKVGLGNHCLQTTWYARPSNMHQCFSICQDNRREIEYGRKTCQVSWGIAFLESHDLMGFVVGQITAGRCTCHLDTLRPSPIWLFPEQRHQNQNQAFKTNRTLKILFVSLLHDD